MGRFSVNINLYNEEAKQLLMKGSVFHSNKKEQDFFTTCIAALAAYDGTLFSLVNKYR